MNETVRANKAMARRIIEEVIDGADLDLAAELIAADYVEHSPSGAPGAGLPGLLEWIRSAPRGFPDWQHHIDLMVAEDDKVVVLTTVRGTHRGEWNGMAPTGRQVAEPGIDVFRIADGKMVEHWGQYDWLRITRQLRGEAPAVGWEPSEPPAKAEAV